MTRNRKAIAEDLDARLIRALKRDGASKPIDISRSLYGPGVSLGRKVAVGNICMRLTRRGVLIRRVENRTVTYEVAP